MKVAFSSMGADINSEIDPRFGRCPYHVIVDLSNKENFKAIPNTDSSCGAGIRAATKVANENVEIVYTGNMGPNASDVFSEVGIKVITGVTGTIAQVAPWN